MEGAVRSGPIEKMVGLFRRNDPNQRRGRPALPQRIMRIIGCFKKFGRPAQIDGTIRARRATLLESSPHRHPQKSAISATFHKIRQVFQNFIHVQVNR